MPIAKALPLVALGIVGIALFALVLFATSSRSAPAPLLVVSTPVSTAAATRSATVQTGREIKVYVAGAVSHPGVYTFQKGDRVDNAVTAAGGMTKDADPDHVNLAAMLVDGQQVEVPRLSATNSPTPGGTSGARRHAGTPGASDAVNPAAPININTASSAELRSLPGIGELTARNIVDYRQRHGLFNSTADLLKVPIHRSVYERIKDRVTVGG